MNELQIIKKTIQEIVGENLSRIILFGSRARGDNRPDSDYDLLVLLKRDIDRNEYVRIYSNILKELARHSIWLDLLIKSESKYLIHSRIVGLCSYEIAREGIAL